MSTAISTGLGHRLVSSSIEATGFTQLPIIDLTPILPGSTSSLEKRQAVALELQAACVDVGFFLIKNHGIDERVFDEALKQARAFFSLPLDEKLKIDMKNAKSFKGYICQFLVATAGTARGGLVIGPNPTECGGQHVRKT